MIAAEILFAALGKKIEADSTTRLGHAQAFLMNYEL